jgi:hypothetical protein
MVGRLQPRNLRYKNWDDAATIHPADERGVEWFKEAGLSGRAPDLIIMAKMRADETWSGMRFDCAGDAWHEHKGEREE